METTSETAQTLARDQPSFLRATVQRAGAIVLVPPRFAARHLPSPVQRFVPAFLSTQGPGGAGRAVEGALNTARSSASLSAAGSASSSAAAAPSAPIQLPAPITYLTSPYLFATLALAFFLHRIRHLVPPRQAFTTPARTHNAGVRTAMHRVLRPTVQVGLRAPGMLIMLRVAVACLIAIALAHGRSVAWVFPVSAEGGHATLLGHACRGALRLLVWSTAWAGTGQVGSLLGATSAADLARAVDHDALLWSAFVAAALGLTCETFVRALADDTSNTQHLNLLSFSFLLHVHSSPARRAAGEDSAAEGEGAWRPPTNLYTFLVLLLLELVALQLSYCAHFLLSPPPSPGRRTSPRKYRLPITAFFSLLQQFFALRSWAVVWGLVPTSAAQRAAEAEQFGTVWLNKVPEICFEVVVGASVAVKALAAVIRGEELSFENVVGHPAMSPTSEEDYPVALIKYSTHLLSTTRLSGLALELDPVQLLPLALATHLEQLGLVDPPPCGDDRCELHGPALRAERERGRGEGVTLGRGGEVLFDAPVEGPAGLAREIRRVSVDASVHGEGAEGEWAGGRSTGGLAHLEGERKSALWAFGGLVARVGLFVLWRAWRAARRAVRGAAASVGWRSEEWELERGWGAEERRGSPEWERREGGEDEDEDGEWVPRGEEGSESEWDEWDDEDDVDVEGMLVRRAARSPSPSADAEDDDPPLALVAAAAADDAEGEALAPYLVAHQLARASNGPLTRRRYRALLPSSSGGSPAPAAALSSAIAARRSEVLASLPGAHPAAEELEERRAQWREERARFCVVCTVEERCIVLWPCRCLCLCEGCRASLADRTTSGAGMDGAGGAGGGGGSLCPTCRSEVQGFSRIWVP
ncbi:hypothetical protein JCM10449v2_006784 [Rhodotorula kratochvilovae]